MPCDQATMTRPARTIATALLALSLGGKASAQEAAQDGGGSFAAHLTLAVPFVSFHTPNDRQFNDHNWGGVLFYALDDHVSLAAGDFVNSYHRNTAIAGVSLTPWAIDLSSLEISPGVLAGFDLNGGYKGYDPLSPLLGAGFIKIGARDSGDPRAPFLDRLGLMATVIPGFGGGRSTAFNLALTVRL